MPSVGLNSLQRYFALVLITRLLKKIHYLHFLTDEEIVAPKYLSNYP